MSHTLPTWLMTSASGVSLILGVPSGGNLEMLFQNCEEEAKEGNIL